MFKEPKIAECKLIYLMIEMRFAGGDYQLRGAVWNDASAVTYTSWVTLTAGR